MDGNLGIFYLHDSRCRNSHTSLLHNQQTASGMHEHTEATYQITFPKMFPDHARGCDRAAWEGPRNQCSSWDERCLIVSYYVPLNHFLVGVVKVCFLWISASLLLMRPLRMHLRWLDYSPRFSYHRVVGSPSGRRWRQIPRT